MQKFPIKAGMDLRIFAEIQAMIFHLISSFAHYDRIYYDSKIRLFPICLHVYKATY